MGLGAAFGTYYENLEKEAEKEAQAKANRATEMYDLDKQEEQEVAQLFKDLDTPYTDPSSVQTTPNIVNTSSVSTGKGVSDTQLLDSISKNEGTYNTYSVAIENNNGEALISAKLLQEE